MKKLFFLGAVLCSVAFLSCKKYSAGCTDTEAENYSNLAKHDDGSCMYHHSTDVQVSNWTYSDPAYSTIIAWENLTQEVIDRGSFSVYMVYNDNSVSEMPFTESFSSSYSSHWYYEAKAGEVKIIRYDSDLIDPGYPGTAVIRVSASW